MANKQILGLLVLVLLADRSKDLSGQTAADPQSRSTIADRQTVVANVKKVWESNMFPFAKGSLALSPNGAELAIMDNDNHKLTVIKWALGETRFQIDSAPAAIRFSADGSRLCIAQFGEETSRKALLVDSQTGETVSSISGVFKGCLRYDIDRPDSHIFFVRMTHGKIGKLNFDTNDLTVVFDPANAHSIAHDAGPIESMDQVSDYDVSNNTLFGNLSLSSRRTVFAFSLDAQKLLWHVPAKQGGTLFVSGDSTVVSESEVTTPFLRNSTYCSVLNSKTGTVISKLSDMDKTRYGELLRNNSNNLTFILNEVSNQPQKGRFTLLEIYDTAGNSVSSTDISEHRTGYSGSDLVSNEQNQPFS